MGMRRIPIGDFPIGTEEREAILRVLDSGRISEHREVRAFEEEFADWMDVEHCVAVSSGTAALICGLQALKYAGYVPSYPRVLIPALTFIAAANAAALSGYRITFIDVDDSFTMRPWPEWEAGDVVLPVHLFGYPAAMGRIKERAQEQKFIVVEDAAEAHGATSHGDKVGSLGLWGAFSFYIAHTIQAGEFGALVTNDPLIAGIARSIKAHGRLCACKRCLRSEGKCPNLKDGDPRSTFKYIGYNFKPMEFQAALARVQLSKIEENIAKRNENVARLVDLLRPLGGVIKSYYGDRNAVLMAYPIVLNKKGIRNRVIAELEKRGVECRPLFGCIPTQQPSYSEYKDEYRGRLPIAEHFGANGFYIGCHQYLDRDDIQYAAKQVVEVVKEMAC